MNGATATCQCSNDTSLSTFAIMTANMVNETVASIPYMTRRLAEKDDKEDYILWEMIFVTITIAIMFYLMITDKVYPDWVMLGGLMLFAITQIISIKEALAGFSNEGILTVLALFVLADGLSRTGALDYYMGKILGRPTTVAGAQLRLCIPIVMTSAFFNNTPIVAMMIPVVLRWSKMIGCPKQQLLIPLSYATILGGTCTLVGTSTNIVLAGLLSDKYPDEPAGNIQLFDVAIYGVPNAIIGILYICCFSTFILPGGKNSTNGGDVTLTTCEYDDLLIGARVLRWSPVAGRTVKRSGLNTSAGIYLVNVRRATTGNIHRAVSPDFVVSVGDELYFTGNVEEFTAFCEKHGLEILTTENIENDVNDEVFSEDDTTPTMSVLSAKPNGTTTNNDDVCTERLQILNRISDQIDGQTPVEPGPRPTRVIVTRDAFHTDRIILVAVDCADRPGLLSDISDALFQYGKLQIKHSESNVVEGRSLSVWRCELLNDQSSANVTMPTTTTLTKEALADPNSIAILDTIWSVVSQVLSDVVGIDSSTGATGTSVPKTSGAQVVRAVITKSSSLIGKKPTEVSISSSSIYRAAIVAYQKTNGKNGALNTPFDAGDLLVLATKEGSPLLQTPPQRFYTNKKELKSLSSRSSITKSSSIAIGIGGASDTNHSDNSSDENDLENETGAKEVWNNLRVLSQSNPSSGSTILDGAKGEFLTAFTIPPKSPLDGKTLSELGYSKLPGVVLVSCERPTSESKVKDTMSVTSKMSTTGGNVSAPRFKPFDPDLTKLAVGDLLWFSGSADAIADLQRINGLAFYQESAGAVLQDRRLIQAVVARSSPLVGRTVNEVDFRSVYGGVVLAIQRGSERVHDHPGNVKLHTGDVLLIEADTLFAKSHSRNYKVFALVSEVEDSSPPRPQMFFLCLVLIFTAFACSAIESIDQSLFVLSAIVGVLMAMLGVLTQQEARDAIQWDLFIVVAAAFGVSSAMLNSGVADKLATVIVNVGDSLGIGDAGVYGAVYFVVNVLSSILTNNAAAVLAFPIAMEAVDQTGLDRLKMSFIIMLSASDYITSFGYQTNLMVYGPGEYSNMDYLRFGAPMQILLWFSSVALVASSTSTWYVSWIICIIGFVVIMSVRLSGGTVIHFVREIIVGKGTSKKSLTAAEDKTSTTKELNNSWHFRRNKHTK